MTASPNASRRVVITGLGVICPLGLTVDALWQGLTSGQSAVGPLTDMPPDFPVTFGGQARQFRGEIDDFGIEDPKMAKAVKKSLKLMCRECQFGVAAAQRAISHAGLAPGSHDPERVGIVFGCDYLLTDPTDLQAGIQQCALPDRFDFGRWGTEGMAKMPPLWLLKYLPNMPACHVAIYNDFRGPNNSLTHREASGNLAIGEAVRIILRGSADIVISGATGTRLHPIKRIHVLQQEQVALVNGREPARVPRPFDLLRSGAVLGEGAGAVVLEELESALRRGATIYGEILGAGSSTVLDRNFVAHRDTALANAMRMALRTAGFDPSRVGHVHAHGLSTRSGDIEESRAIREVFGSHADRLPVTAAKSYFGNLGAGSGVVEMIASVLALQHGHLFPVLNYEKPDPECPLRVATSTEVPSGETFMNLSVTPQGQASCLLVRRWQP